MAQFRKGNPGKPKGAIARIRKDLAQWCRDESAKLAPVILQDIHSLGRSVRAITLKVDVWRELNNRGWGRAPQTIDLGVGLGGIEALLLEMADQPVPGRTFERGDEAAPLPALEPLPPRPLPVPEKPAEAVSSEPLAPDMIAPETYYTSRGRS